MSEPAASPRKTVVLALGGNAIIKPGEKGTITQQFANTRQALKGAAGLIRKGYGLVITHGNGPQVGNSLLRVEAVSDRIPEIPLGVLVADTEGGMGYMIQQSLHNMLWLEKIRKPVVTIVTQIVVDRHDPRLKKPVKPIGPFFSVAEAKDLIRRRGWAMKEDSGRGWRRIVASPLPMRIVERETIMRLVESGIIVIAAGGGGIPVVIEPDGRLEGVDVVVDKDLAASILAQDTRAKILIITTGVDKLSLNFNTPQQKDLNSITVEEAQHYLQEGHFPAGSMGPKIEASIRFLEQGGEQVIITSPDRVAEAIDGRAGTHIIHGPEPEHRKRSRRMTREVLQ
ncbi:MAG TPA: carbamate kinase [Elusimicrobia bacterium]|nr:carbamate kinase [Elusimicrobiota bacterium]